MPDFYTKNDSGIWVRSDSQYVKYPSVGWKRVTDVMEKTGATTWTGRIVTDVTPPGPPIISNVSTSFDPNLITMSVKLPSDPDVVGGVMKLWHSAYPTTPTGSNGIVTTQPQADGKSWSNIDGPPGKTFSRRIDGATPGRKYYMRAWAVDQAGNWSSPASYYLQFPYPPAPAPKLVTKTAYINVTASGSWNRTSRYWRNDSAAKHVYQGGDGHWDGRWFYGSAIKTALAKAHQIQEIKVYIQRVNSQHGVSARAQSRIGAHNQTSRPSGAPNALKSVTNGPALLRNEGAWWTVPSGWHAGFKSGGNAGLGLYAGATSYTHPNYLIAHGHGTSSGRIYLKWTEYA